MKRIYMDYAATTPTDPEVLKAVVDTMRKVPGNPASLHAEGRLAKEVVDNARASIARILSANPQEIVFTSGGTEANSLAIVGLVKSLWTPHIHKAPHIITTAIEHSSVLEPIRRLESEGAEVTYIKPDAEGIINPKDIRDALRPNTVLVSVMYANNEVGTIQPIKEIAKVIRHFRSTQKVVFWDKRLPFGFPYFHVDAAQALGYCDMNTQKLGADLISFDGGKIYGPKGVGALYIKRGTPVAAQTLGGGQEKGLRSGTENTALIAGLAKAFEINEKVKVKESVRLSKLRDYFIKKLLELEGATLNGSKEERLPNNISVCIKGFDAEFAVYQLDEKGVAASSASTCMSLKEDSYSYVVEEMRPGEDCGASSLRFSLGRGASKLDVDVCMKALREVLLMQWSISPNNK